MSSRTPIGEPGPEARMSDPGSSSGTTHGLTRASGGGILPPFLWAPMNKGSGREAVDGGPP